MIKVNFVTHKTMMIVGKFIRTTFVLFSNHVMYEGINVTP